jgi:hypothetical protein
MRHVRPFTDGRVRSRVPRRPWFLPLVALSGLVIAGVSIVIGVSTRAHPISRGTVPAVASPSTGPTSATTPTRAPMLVGSVPVSIAVPQLRVTAPVVPVGVSAAGALDVPADIHELGWWAGGALAGSTGGTVVLDGHVDSAAAGAGALYELRTLTVGSTVDLRGSEGTFTYRITGVREYRKGALPAASLFAQSGQPRLVLITCGGPFDAATHHYRDNIAAFGVPVSP